jgi:hypothetical protein
MIYYLKISFIYIYYMNLIEDLINIYIKYLPSCQDI